MSNVPENAALCGCYANATAAERAERGVGVGMFRPSALRDCPVCRGAGFWLPPPNPLHMSAEVRWRVYRFECPHVGCGSAFEQADHQRRDPSTMEASRCSKHRCAMEFSKSRPLYDRMVKRIERWGRIETAAREVVETDFGTVYGREQRADALARLRAALDGGER